MLYQFIKQRKRRLCLHKKTKRHTSRRKGNYFFLKTTHIHPLFLKNIMLTPIYKEPYTPIHAERFPKISGKETSLKHLLKRGSPIKK